jgi:hypothetical protein
MIQRQRRGDRSPTVRIRALHIWICRLHRPFENRHRAGFGRLYDPTRTDVNLVYVTAPGYDYDRPRRSVEGGVSMQ